MNKIEKGNPGYLKNQKTVLIIRAAILAFIIIAFVILSRITSDSMKKIMTVMAILMVLPFANIGTVFLAMMPYVGKTTEERNEITDICTNELLRFELVVTSSNDPTMYFPYLSIYSGQIVALLEGDSADTKRSSEYLTKMLDANGIETTVHVYTDPQEFKKKLQEMEPYALKRESCSNKLLKTESVILALSM